LLARNFSGIRRDNAGDKNAHERDCDDDGHEDGGDDNEDNDEGDGTAARGIG
jgi:hypothetical protein